MRRFTVVSILLFIVTAGLSVLLNGAESETPENSGSTGSAAAKVTTDEK